jgi:hypothetical protein
LLKILLEKDAAKRIENVKDLKRHPWLNGVNWTLLIQKEIEPPYIPSLRETNFDPEFNDLDCDFDEADIKRMDTNRRFSYYYESTLQSKQHTENSVYQQTGGPEHPIQRIAMG